jgi:hypothetical protein
VKKAAPTKKSVAGAEAVGGSEEDEDGGGGDCALDVKHAAAMRRISVKLGFGSGKDDEEEEDLDEFYADAGGGDDDYYAGDGGEFGNNDGDDDKMPESYDTAAFFDDEDGVDAPGGKGDVTMPVPVASGLVARVPMRRTTIDVVGFTSRSPLFGGGLVATKPLAPRSQAGLPSSSALASATAPATAPATAQRRASTGSVLGPGSPKSPLSEWRKSWSYQATAIDEGDDLSQLLRDFGLDPAQFYSALFDAGATNVERGRAFFLRSTLLWLATFRL